MKKIKVRFFGAFRKYVPSGVGEVSLDEVGTVGDLRAKIKSYLVAIHPEFNQESLIMDSALANDERILNDSDSMQEQSSIAVLPPVCGG